MNLKIGGQISAFVMIAASRKDNSMFQDAMLNVALFVVVRPFPVNVITMKPKKF